MARSKSARAERRREAAAREVSRERASRGAARSDATSLAASASAALVVLMTLAASAEIFHIGFFADDFHFLDVARRIPLMSALAGGHGVYPWYRPLSRELYFAIVSRFGAAAPLAAHALSLACLTGMAWLLLRLAQRLAGGAAAGVAPVLLVTYAYTRFLSAWASGFQDLLAALLTVFAVLDHARGRRARAVVWILLAPLAKETGFLALPLVLLYAGCVEDERRPRRWMAPPALAATAAAALHVLARLSWKSAGSRATINASPADLLSALASAFSGFVGHSPVLAPATLAFAALTALAAAALLALRRGGDAPVSPTPGRALSFAALATALGLAPLVVGSALRQTSAHPYYAFPAIPWLCLLATLALANLPRRAWRWAAIGVPALAAWNVLALGFRPPGPLEDSAWVFRSWDWREAARLSVISSRLAADLRAALPSGNDSLVVLYGGLPTGTFFQTEDGPATRLALADPTVRAYYLNGPPLFVMRDRFAVLMFDPAIKRLGTGAMPPAERIRAAATAIFRGQAETAWAYASWADSSDYAHPDRAYARAAARLLSGGAGAFRAALAAGGLADSLGEAPARLAAWEFPADPALRLAYQAVLRSPLMAERHAALADGLLARGFTVAAGFELRLATALDPARAADAAKLQALIEREARDSEPVNAAPN